MHTHTRIFSTPSNCLVPVSLENKDSPLRGHMQMYLTDPLHHITAFGFDSFAAFYVVLKSTPNFQPCPNPRKNRSFREEGHPFSAPSFRYSSLHTLACATLSSSVQGANKQKKSQPMPMITDSFQTGPDPRRRANGARDHLHVVWKQRQRKAKRVSSLDMILARYSDRFWFCDLLVNYGFVM